jgi:hypothetical protein
MRAFQIPVWWPRGLRRALAGLFWIGLCLPVWQQVSGRPADVRLNGAETRVAAPVLTWKSWFSGEFSRQAADWMEQRVGFRGWLVKGGNQLSYSLFGRTIACASGKVMIGRDRWLFERSYVQHYLRRPGIAPAARDALVADCAAVGRALAQRGAAFVVLVAPSKAEIWPENLPAEVRPGDRLAALTNAYDALVPPLTAAGVRVLDAHRLFLEWKPTHPPLFAPGGTHWNYHGAQLVAQELFAGLRDLPAFAGLPVPSVTGFDRLPAGGTDVDLRDLINLWRFEPHGPPRVAFPRLAPPPAEAAAPTLDVLLIGDSFGFQMVDALARTRLVRNLDFLYYAKRRAAYDLSSPDWETVYSLRHRRADRGPFKATPNAIAQRLEGRALVLLVVNEIQLRDAGWGFLAAARAALGDPAR